MVWQGTSSPSDPSRSLSATDAKLSTTFHVSISHLLINPSIFPASSLAYKTQTLERERERGIRCRQPNVFRFFPPPEISASPARTDIFRWDFRPELRWWGDRDSTTGRARARRRRRRRRRSSGRCDREGCWCRSAPSNPTSRRRISGSVSLTARSGTRYRSTLRRLSVISLSFSSSALILEFHWITEKARGFWYVPTIGCFFIRQLIYLASGPSNMGHGCGAVYLDGLDRRGFIVMSCQRFRGILGILWVPEYLVDRRIRPCNLLKIWL